MATEESVETVAVARKVARSLTRECATLFGAAFFLVLGVALAALFVGIIAQNLYVLVAAIFILLPYTLLIRQGLDFEIFGLTMRGWPRGALWGLGAAILTLPLFFAGFYLWETRVSERTFDYDHDHYRQWPAELEGKPTTWGTGPGVWVWTSNGDLRIGVPGKPVPFQDIEVSANTPFYWHSIGSARALPSSTSEGIQLGESSVRARHGLAQTWHVGPGPMGTRAELVLSPRTFKDSPETLPDSLRIRSYSTREGGEGAPIFTGPTASPVDGDLEIDRTRMWLLLWALTHLFFVALPEEYFYRGYLQTRIGQALKARRMARGKSDEPRRWLGISWSNLITSSLFALGHVLIPVGGALLISRAAVFFPSLLFGWLRERTDSIVAPVIYHGACNMMVIIAAVHFV